MLYFHSENKQSQVVFLFAAKSKKVVFPPPLQDRVVAPRRFSDKGLTAVPWYYKKAKEDLSSTIRLFIPPVACSDMLRGGGEEIEKCDIGSSLRTLVVATTTSYCPGGCSGTSGTILGRGHFIVVIQ